ncbi:MAG: glycosyltransferase [Planctomycetota bacterium]
MRVLMVVHDFLPRHRAGTEIYAEGLARRLAAEGDLELRLLFTESHPGVPPGRVRRGEHHGIPTVEISSDHLVRPLLATFRSEEALAVLAAELAEFRPDVVHFQHLLHFGWEAVAIARAAGARTTITLHDFFAVCPRLGRMVRADGERCERAAPELCRACVAEIGWRAPEAASRGSALARALARLPESIKRPLRALRPRPTPSVAPATEEDLVGAEIAAAERLAVVREALDLADSLVSPSAFLRDRLVASEVVDAERVEVSPNGQDPRGLAPAAGVNTDGSLRVGFVGTITEAKGTRVLVEAAQRLDADIEVRIHGDPGVDPDHARSLRALDSVGRVAFAGGFEPAEIGTVLAGLDVLVVPSLWWENAPLTIQEAFLAGVVPVVSGIGGMAEAVRDGRDGLHFPPGDAAALAERLGRLAADRRLLAALREAAPPVRDLESDGAAVRARYERALAAPTREPRGVLGSATPPASPRISVVIPTRNGGAEFAGLLDRILAQRHAPGFEVIVIDSGSTDGTLERVRRRPSVRLVEIAPETFDHGLTRQRGVELARGELVAFLSQDALPETLDYLAGLARHFDDPDVAGVTAGQVPRPGCNPWQRERLRPALERRDVERRRLEGDWEALAPRERLRLCAYDHVAAMTRRADLLARPLRARAFGEDLAFGRDAILAGRTLIADPTVRVVHSHERSIGEEARRVRADHRGLAELFGLRVIAGPGRAFAAGLASTLRLGAAVLRDSRGWGYRLPRLLATPVYAFRQTFAQWRGAREGARD